MSKTFKPNYLYFAAFAGVLAYVAIGGFHALATVEGGQLASQVFMALVASIATFLLWVIGRKFYDYRRGLLLDDEGISCDAFVRRFGDRTIPWSKISDAEITSDSVSLGPRLFLTIRLRQDSCESRLWNPPNAMEFHLPQLWLSVNFEEFFSEFEQRMSCGDNEGETAHDGS